MKKRVARFLCLTLCLSLLAAYIPAAAAMQEGTGEIVEVSEVVYIDQVESSESFYSLDANGNVALKPGNYEKWIDRLDLSDAPFALDFYAWLEANIDGALVDPSGCATYKSNYVYTAKVNTGTIPFTYDDDPESAAAEALTNGLPETLSDVKPYLVAVYSAFDRDHPEIFWLTGGSVSGSSVSYSYSYGGGSGTVKYTQNFYFYLTNSGRNFDVRQETYRTASSIHTAAAQRDTAVEQILSQVTATNTYEQVRQLNRILTTTNCYHSNVSSAPDSSYECTSALLGSTGSAGPVCEGYSRAFKVLCDELEIPCVLVDGMSYNSGGSGPHMWNNVQMPDGNWYAVDVTWNDPVVSGKTGAVSGYESENYLLVGGSTVVGDRTFSTSHVVENSVVSGSTCFTNCPVLASSAYTYVPVTSLTLSQTTMELDEGEKIQLTATVTPTNASENTVVWSSDNPSVATVSDGTVTAVSKGEAVITAKIDGVSAQCAVTVTHTHIHADVVTTQPTCTKEGVKTYTCRCGDSYTESIPTVDHNYVDGKCTACGAADPNYVVPVEKFDIPYSQMELGNALNLHFLFPVSACDDWTGAYAVITKSYADGRADVTVTVPAADWGAENYGVDYHDAAFTNIAAKEMTDEITIVVYNADGVAISNPRTDSIRNYLLRNLENYDSAELRALVVDMLNYGAAAQEKFGYNTDDLANKDLTAEQKAFGTATMKTCTDKRVKGANFLGTGLELNNSIVLNMYFNGLTSDMTAKVTFTDHNNQPVTADAVIADGIVYVDQIVVADARQLVTVTVYDANGSVYGTATDSLESCVARASASDTIYQAIMKFADSAYAYLH